MPMSYKLYYIPSFFFYNSLFFDYIYRYLLYKMWTKFKCFAMIRLAGSKACSEWERERGKVLQIFVFWCMATFNPFFIGDFTEAFSRGGGAFKLKIKLSTNLKYKYSFFFIPNQGQIKIRIFLFSWAGSEEKKSDLLPAILIPNTPFFFLMISKIYFN